VLVPVVTLEGAGVFASLRRCLQLTAGQTFRLTAWLIPSGVVAIAAVLGMQVLFARLVPEEHAALFLSSAVGDTLIGSFLVILLTEIYLHLLPQRATIPLPANQPRRNRSGLFVVVAWIGAWLSVAIGVGAAFIITSPTSTPTVVSSGGVDARVAVLSAAQMPGYTPSNVESSALVAAVIFQGSSATPFLSVSSEVSHAAGVARALTLEQQLLPLLRPSDSQQVLNLKQIGSNFEAFVSADSGVLIWTQGPLVCALSVGTFEQPPNMQLADQLAQLQEANVLAAAG